MKIFLIIILFSYPVIVVAQDEITGEYSIDEIKVEALKVKTDIFSSPVKVTLLNRKRIESLNGNKLSDILKHTQGFYIKSYGGSLSLQTISLNGLSAEQSLVLIDGQKINSNQNSLVDLSLISKDDIERIEILNSGASALYGSEAISGVVNIITSNGNPNKNISLNVKAETGSYGSGRVFGSVLTSYDNLRLSTSFSSEHSSGNYEYYYGTGLQKVLKTRSHSDYRMKTFRTGIEFDANESVVLSLSGNYVRSGRNLPGIETGNAPSKSHQADENIDAVLNLDIKGEVNILSQVFFKNHLMNYRIPGILDDYYKNFDVSNRTEIEYKKFNGGIEAGYSKLYSGNVNEFSGRIKLSGFLGSVFDLSDRLKFYPSVRIDHYSDIAKNSITGKAGVNYKPFDSETLNLRINLGNNFRVPTFNDLYWNNSGNGDLKPETSVNIDGGLIYGFRFLTENIFNLSVSYIDYTDRIIWLPGTNGLWKPENVDRTLSVIYQVGIESKFRFQDAGIIFSTAFTKNNSVRKTNVESDGKQLIYVPQEQLQAGLNLEYKSISVNVDYILYGKRFTDQLNTMFLRAVDILDGNISYKLNAFGSEVLFRFEVNNILNSDYEFVSGYPMPLRNYNFSVGFKY